MLRSLWLLFLALQLWWIVETAHVYKTALEISNTLWEIAFVQNRMMFSPLLAQQYNIGKIINNHGLKQLQSTASIRGP